MITVSDVTLAFGERVLFKDVNLKFTPGNCYGIIGANGAGKSTFLKVLSGELEHDRGEIIVTPGERIAVLKQDHFAFEAYSVMETVLMGFPKLYEIMKEREALYAKESMSDEDGIRAGELEAEFAELGGWEAEAQASQMLSGLGLDEEDHTKMMSDLDESRKVRVLLAQALFGNPDILLLDEPTNGLDLESITWLEDFLIDFPNTVIVVSHDRHFLNTVCTHICDIDYGRITLYSGNYDFWYQMSQMLQRQAREQLKKREEKAKELKEFIQRFASNASKSRQATSRKKVLEKLDLENIPVTSRKFPYVAFKPNRDIGNNVLRVEKLNYRTAEAQLLQDFSIIVNKGDKIAFVGAEHQSKTAFFEIIAGEQKADSGDYYWGQTVSFSYFPKENSRFFNSELSITDWLKQYSPDQDDTYVRSFLGRMLFSGDEALKPVNVLSGGEKVRCLLSKMMLSGANVLIMDEPTNHLDLEAITALNEGLEAFTGVVLFNSHDHEFINSIANRIIEILPGGKLIDRMMLFDDYLKDDSVKALRAEAYHHAERLQI
ncbi:MAG TPA: ABC-F family ATP-binding cassette domain-containing protein [Treponema sp.]|nr:ABC-F family ATP-binding cassette domain-containing protein [Treponema sp.]HON14420.1 ABC-F family ATP-binding cassette domain-containing protein [Treponema sp.]HPC71317.1 ABC-F family ATP-binding cassette domain-containing protein [Treponema sp.]HRS04438.1 ABC-F family ATP-binding cassette domain-containing protein [Treponema sp.]HRU28947.1 ABC-F family ATP-binding cassette domain-containing protein [Treponema sp.]